MPRTWLVLEALAEDGHPRLGRLIYGIARAPSLLPALVRLGAIFVPHALPWKPSSATHGWSTAGEIRRTLIAPALAMVGDE
jgi:hypothetical protein